MLVSVGAGICAFNAFSSGRTRLTPLPAHAGSAAAFALPRPAHVVVVIEENEDPEDVVGRADAPYINHLIALGAYFTQSYGVAHPSQPNYLALFAGITDTNGDACPPAGIAANAPNLASELRAAGLSFAGYAEGLPRARATVCVHGFYARKHVPWVDFDNIPPSARVPQSDMPPFDRLPTVSFVVPDLADDMHDGSKVEKVKTGDRWLKQHVGPLVEWGAKHDALVILTWDESDNAIRNHIPTVFVGPMVKPGRYDEPITHYRVLRTIEDMYGLPHAGLSAAAYPIRSVWRVRRTSGRA